MTTLVVPQTIVGTPGGHSIPSSTVGGRFDFDDGGVYIGGWLDGKAHGHGVCTGPKSQGEYSGSWNYGFELSGVYKWPSGATYEGQWQNGKRHGIGVEYRGKWVYKGEWTQGYKGRYGVRASLLSAAKYEGTWANGLQDGYGSESYADGGTYQGQWLRGMRHGYGVRQSAAFGHCNITKTAMSAKNNSMNVSMQSLSTDIDGGTLVDPKRDATMRGGFVLVVKTSGSFRRRNSLTEKSSNIKTSIMKGLRLRKQRSAGDVNVPQTDARSHRSSASVASSVESASGARGDNEEGDAVSNASFLTTEGDIGDPSTTETYIGEWKNDKRCGFGICERSDGVRYEGEWYNNKKYGYGVTTFRDGNREEGKYKNNQLVTSIKKKHLFVIRSAKTRERIDSAVQAASRAQQIALQKADIAISRTATARGKAEQADYAAAESRNDSIIAFNTAKSFGGTGVSANFNPETAAAGSMMMSSLIPDNNMSPLRRRLSEFSSIRRGTKDSLGGGVLGSGAGGGPGFGTSGPSGRQFLDPNVPFGGRRGSFRSDQPTGSSANLLIPSNVVPQQQQQQQSSQFNVQQGMMNVPRMSFEPPTPSIPQPQQQLQQQQQPPPSSHYSRQPAPPPPIPQQQLNPQQSQQQFPPIPAQRQSPSSQSSQSQFSNPVQQQQQQSNFYQQSMPSSVPSQQSQTFNTNRKQSQPYQQQQQQQFNQQQQQQQQQLRQRQQLQSSLSTDSSFADHFDHYSYRTMMTRYGSVPRQTPPIPAKRRSRTPLPPQQQPMVRTASPSPFPPPRMAMTPSPSSQSSSFQQQQQQQFAPLRPSPSQRSFNEPLQGEGGNLVGGGGGSGSAAGSIMFDTSNNASSVNLLLLSNDVRNTNNSSFGSNLNDLPNQSMFPQPSSSRGSWRTSSLSRPSPGPPQRLLLGSGVGGGHGGGVLRRKPSVPEIIPINLLHNVNPVISREEASILSHNQREMLRTEAEMAEKLRSNPLLYFVSPNFKDWLSRKKLTLLILFINISLATLFYQLFG